MLWNANADRARGARRRPGELRAELRRWERERGAGARRASAREAALALNVREYRVRPPLCCAVRC